MTEFFNRGSEKERRRELRGRMPLAEVLLWSQLRRGQLLGYRFRRQYSVGSFIVDFYCPRLKLAIELDGDSHFSEEAKAYDARRQHFIEEFGIRFLRFTNQDVLDNMDGVLEVIARAVEQGPPQP
ncbi:endonuclease domain-containing protein [Aquisphaera insulae]|uniref:endonuclease domain-containing protein n=1 Tax=Aquisphaera insulae TaxID=2712864 RepID=UPI0013EE3E02|nr:endonuclease domain-containing protein [Aquisphaera insulae]